MYSSGCLWKGPWKSVVTWASIDTLTESMTVCVAIGNK